MIPHTSWKPEDCCMNFASLEVVKKACFGNDGFSESDTQGEPYYTRWVNKLQVVFTGLEGEWPWYHTWEHSNAVTSSNEKKVQVRKSGTFGLPILFGFSYMSPSCQWQDLPRGKIRMVLVRHGNLNTVSYCHPVIGQAFIHRGIAGYPRTLGLWHCLLLLSIHLGFMGTSEVIH